MSVRIITGPRHTFAELEAERDRAYRCEEIMEEARHSQVNLIRELERQIREHRCTSSCGPSPQVRGGNLSTKDGTS